MTDRACGQCNDQAKRPGRGIVAGCFVHAPRREGMKRERSRLIVEIDLDPVPGWGNRPEDHLEYVRRILNGSIPHYNPTVTIEGTPEG